MLPCFRDTVQVFSWKFGNVAVGLGCLSYNSNRPRNQSSQSINQSTESVEVGVESTIWVTRVDWSSQSPIAKDRSFGSTLSILGSRLQGKRFYASHMLITFKVTNQYDNGISVLCRDGETTSCSTWHCFKKLTLVVFTITKSDVTNFNNIW